MPDLELELEPCQVESWMTDILFLMLGGQQFFGLISVTQAAAPYMIRHRSGVIVNIGSVAAIACMPFGGPYSASKSAVHAASDTLRLELAPFNIHVVVVAPGAIKSSISDNTRKTRSTPTPNSADEGDLGYLPADSLYKHVEDLVKFRAEFSQQGEPTPSETFAKNVRKWVAVSRPGAYLFTGKKSLGVWISYYLPTRVKDWVIGRIFQIHRIGSNAHKNKNI